MNYQHTTVFLERRTASDKLDQIAFSLESLPRPVPRFASSVRFCAYRFNLGLATTNLSGPWQELIPIKIL